MAGIGLSVIYFQFQDSVALCMVKNPESANPGNSHVVGSAILFLERPLVQLTNASCLW